MSKRKEIWDNHKVPEELKDVIKGRWPKRRPLEEWADSVIYKPLRKYFKGKK